MSPSPPFLQITWMCRRVREHVNCVMGQEHVVSYLPLSHIAPQLLDIYTVLTTAGTCWFAQPDALKGSLLQVCWVVVQGKGTAVCGYSLF